MRTKLASLAAWVTISLNVAISELGIEIETEMGQLERDIDLQPFRGDAVEIGDVLVDDGPRRRRVLDSFAEQRGIGAQPLLVERAQDRDRLVEGLAGDEPRSPQPHAVAANETGDETIARGGQNAGPKDGVEIERGPFRVPATVPLPAA